MNKKILALLFATISVVLVLFSFLGPWYNFHFDLGSNIFEMDVKYEFNFYLSEANFQGLIFGRNISQTEDYGNIINLLSKIPGNAAQSSSINQVFSVFETTRLFVFFSLIFSIITFLGLAISFLYSNKNKHFQDFNIILGILFSGISFCSFFYFFIAWNSVIVRGLSLLVSTAGHNPIPSIISQVGFWFYHNQGGIQISMGPGPAWYFMLFSGISGLFAVVLILKINNQEKVDK